MPVGGSHRGRIDTPDFRSYEIVNDVSIVLSWQVMTITTNLRHISY